MITDIRDLDIQIVVPELYKRMTTDELHRAIVGYVQQTIRRYKDAREQHEQIWVQAWSSYLGTKQAQNYSRMQTLQMVGNVSINWRHQINVGKLFDCVETIHAYLMNSLFPNTQWFDVQPVMPGYRELARIIKYYTQHKLNEWDFLTHFASYLRQLVITGDSCMALPWSDEHVEYETLDVFDTYVDPQAVSASKSAFARKIKKTRAAVLSSATRGFYKGFSQEHVISIRPTIGSGFDVEVDYDFRSNQIREFNGIAVYPFSWDDKITLYEFWGDIHLDYCTVKDVVVTIVGNSLARLVNNTYKCGIPFVYGNFIPVVRQPYGVSAVQSSLGMIQQLNNSVNQMLDGIELAVNPMWTLLRDGNLQDKDVVSEPGKVFEVDNHDSLRPVTPPSNNFQLSFSQNSFLEQQIDKNVGTGSLVGHGTVRKAERVTATEISAVQSAGGNRLLGYHQHVQRTSLLPMLQKTFTSIQQFTRIDDTIAVPSSTDDSILYYDVGSRELKLQYKVIPRGADYVIERDDYIQKRMDFINLILQMPPERQAKFDIEAILLDLMYNWGFDNPEQYLTKQQASAQEMQPNSLMAMGGQAAENVLLENLQADGGASLFKSVFGRELPPQALNQPTPQL